MTDNQLLEKSSVEAVRSAATKLNVDPLRFARFLQQGRIADILSPSAGKKRWRRTVPR
jgi:hypothetical protein